MLKEKSETQDLEDQRKTIEIYARLLEQANRNFEEKVKELSIVRHLGESLLYAQDLKKICRVILDVIVQEFDTEFGSLMLLNREKNVLKLFAATSQLESAIKYFDDSSQVLIPVGEGIAGLAAKEKESILIPDTDNDKRFVPRSTGRLIRSLLCVPLVSRGQVLGVVNLSSPLKGAFSEKDQRIMKIVGDQAALAIENSMLIRDRMRTERMSAIGNMAATIVHDIKNPMAKIKGFAEIMVEPDTSQADREECAGIIVSEIDRFVAMTEELMEFSRGGETRLSLQPVQLKEFIQGILPFLRRDFADRNIELITSLDYNPSVQIDIQKFQRVVFNLTGNARDAMPEGGKITIRSWREGGLLVLSISDTGKGIPKEIQEKLFIPFVTHGKAKGTGLGLAIVKKIVEDHGGSVEARNEEGAGAEFIVRLPAEGEEYIKEIFNNV